MIKDKLCLNDSKTEFIIVRTRQQLAQVNIDQLCVGESSIVPVTVKNLGSWFDKNMSMTTPIIKVCKAASHFASTKSGAYENILQVNLHIAQLGPLLSAVLIIVTAYYSRFRP